MVLKEKSSFPISLKGAQLAIKSLFWNVAVDNRSKIK